MCQVLTKTFLDCDFAFAILLVSLGVRARLGPMTNLQALDVILGFLKTASSLLPIKFDCPDLLARLQKFHDLRIHVLMRIKAQMAQNQIHSAFKSSEAGGSQRPWTKRKSSRQTAR